MARSYPLATPPQSDYSWMRSWQVEYAIDRLKRREFIIPSHVGTNPTRCLMRRWFLSYHSPDRALAERLKAALERKDTNARVFFAPSSLRAGGVWSRALADEITQAEGFILLVVER